MGNMYHDSVGIFAIEKFWDILDEDYNVIPKLVLRNIIQNITYALDGESVRKITDSGRRNDGRYYIEIEGNRCTI